MEANFLTINQKIKNLITTSTNDIGNFSFGQNFELDKKSVNDQLLKSLFYNISQEFLSKINPVLSMSYNQNLSENEEFFINDNLQLKSSKSELFIKSYLYKDILSQNKSDLFLIKSGSEENLFSNTKEEESTPSNWGLSLSHNFKFSNKTRWESQILFNRRSFDETSKLNNNQTFFQNELGENLLYLNSDIFIKPSSMLLFYSYNNLKLNEITDAFVLSGDFIFSPNSAESLSMLEQDYFSRNLHFNNTSGLIIRRGAHHIFEFASQFDYHKTDNKTTQSIFSDFENEFYNFSGLVKWTKAIRTTIFEAGLKNALITGNNMPDKFIVLPNVRYKWKNIFTSIDINVFRDIDFLENKFWINSFVSSGFQSFISSTIDSSREFFSVSNIFNSSIYHNLGQGSFDLGLDFQARYTPLNFIQDFSANENFFITGIIPLEADEYAVNTSFEISKFISGLSQNFRIVPAHNYSKTVYASNNDIFSNESNSFSIKFETKSAYDGWLNFYTGFTFRNQVFSDKNLMDNSLSNSSNHFFSSFLNLNLNYFDDKLAIRINNNLYDFNTGGTYFYIGDLAATYRANKIPIELNLTIKNFTDKRKFSLFRETPSTISSNNTFLRPLSAIMSLKYVF